MRPAMGGGADFANAMTAKGTLMFKTILVPVRGDDGDKASLGTALSFATLFGGHIEVAHTRCSPPVVAASGGGKNTTEVISELQYASSLRDWDRHSGQRARRQFRKFCTDAKIARADTPGRKRGVSASWISGEGDEIEWIVRLGRGSDVVVLHAAQPDEGGFSPEETGEIILSRGGPVILAPSQPPTRIARTIAIAWKGTAEATATLSAAMPLLYQAEKIFVVSVSEKGAAIDPSVDDVVRRLRRHDLNVVPDRIAADRRSAAAGLKEHVDDLKADLLVMGAYGHNRMRQFIFGSFTKEVLLGASIPVFLSH